MHPEDANPTGPLLEGFSALPMEAFGMGANRTKREMRLSWELNIKQSAYNNERIQLRLWLGI
jgi:hypothetical protein